MSTLPSPGLLLGKLAELCWFYMINEIARDAGVSLELCEVKEAQDENITVNKSHNCRNCKKERNCDIIFVYQVAVARRQR